MFWPCETTTSTCRNFATISSGVYRFFGIAVLLHVKDIVQVGPLQRGRISDVGGLCADRCNPLLHSLGYKLWAVVGPDMAGHATQDEEIGQNIDHIDDLELAGHPDCQAFMGELVDDVEHSIFPAIVGDRD